jgi:hypothetical protein
MLQTVTHARRERNAEFIPAIFRAADVLRSLQVRNGWGGCWDNLFLEW